MGAVKDPVRRSEMMDYVMFSGKVRLQDMAFPLGALSATSDTGGRAAWVYLRDKFSSLQTKYGGSPMRGLIVGLSCRGLTLTAEADEVEAFFEAGAGSATPRLSQALEIVRTHAQRGIETLSRSFWSNIRPIKSLCCHAHKRKVL